MAPFAFNFNLLKNVPFNQLSDRVILAGKPLKRQNMIISMLDSN